MPAFAMTKRKRLDVGPMIAEYRKLLHAEFDVRISRWKPDLHSPTQHEVVGALLSRQVTLALSIVTCIQNWNEHVAPVLLRSMADVHISLVWILGDPKVRSRKYVLYGLGQHKLQIEHRRADMANRAHIDGEADGIKTAEAWIEQQRLLMLTEVDLGSWSGLSTRAMAEEAGCIDFYNYVFSPFSACVHSTWPHIARYNTVECDNPLHGGHLRATILELPSNIHYAILAARYADKSFKSFDGKFNNDQNITSALDYLKSEIERRTK